jgi:hypothetical protein
MSDARAPAMDVHMTPQDAGMARSFWLILSALLIGDNGYPWYILPVLATLGYSEHSPPYLDADPSAF